MNPSPIIRSELHADTRDALARHITAHFCRDESELITELLARADVDTDTRKRIEDRAVALVERVRAKADQKSAVESFMRQYDLSSEEGVLLMCVAEALLRIPDADTADKLIRDKLGEANWDAHLGKSDSLFVNASTWGLMLTGKIIELADETRTNFMASIKRLVARTGEPVVRLAVRQAMRIMGHQFVMGRTIDEALDRSEAKDSRAYRHSFDMLGESALTTADAERYFKAYQLAIKAIGARGPHANVIDAPSISVKLSALHPRYEISKRERVLNELTPKVLALAQLAKAQGIALTIDAEESERLEFSLEIMRQVFHDPSLEGWNGFGLAVQAYQRRALPVIDWLAEEARIGKRRWCVRLVKGAYWDSEVKRAQVDGFTGYPVFTRKPNTDVSYLACAKRLFEHGDLFYPQFATHNAQTIAAIFEHAHGRPFEFQRLHGMGADLYAEVIGANNLNVPCRVYAPVGSHEDLLPYLVRRLLENGANTSFVNRIVDEKLDPRTLVADPVLTVRHMNSIPHPKIPLPIALYGADRKNSMGINLANENDLRQLAEQINQPLRYTRATPLVPGYSPSGTAQPITSPQDRRQKVGEWVAADALGVAKAIDNAQGAQSDWDQRPVAARAALLEHAADLLEGRIAEYMALCTREAGKSLLDGIAEVREAVDFLRYYANHARKLMGQPEQLPGPTGESNQLHLHGRGIFVAISPWNFPLAIFMGQVAAALVTGNCVIAKPAEQTNLIAYTAVRLLHEAGIPEAVLQLLPGDGATVGAALTKDARIAGVAFTGSTETARAINRALAARDAAIAVLIAETGGQNALIADSSALPEQLVKDAISAAFGSAGQRCSAARILLVQDDIADKVVHMLAGAMDEITVGDPALMSTDVGPVIDQDALNMLNAHAERMNKEAKLIKAVTLSDSTAHGSFFAPRAYEIQSLSQLKREVFGPVLHVLRYAAKDLDAVIDQINGTGYGLTLGVHSRIDATVQKIAARAKVGNCYVNRNQIGAVVGVQPFGGEGLSGTGPKAGGPHYLARFVTERTLTINTTAAGGNASLLTIGE
ncbi:bifunctional proline dehydrogenase/L-glutamate gamma-semialdehyde dehydrogenase [Ahniella affigens]|uniref:Bifunctional protein PutA n=1 Tax=Ahniella affigens TaxID=2021234 RepID=A0A2P1PNA7_9GAMM|nr:bifunctional proline dehydrogenase/L-glutamate gamma-semialdehyde dehydrogenase PutA [Ahniella affigens]AVP96334.1 bifunctional proline dehydrogenase/L-glutamate gamma-semialdehyde dehydrogenase [Ahniella affigens]